MGWPFSILSTDGAKNGLAWERSLENLFEKQVSTKKTLVRKEKKKIKEQQNLPTGQNFFERIDRQVGNEISDTY